MTLKSVFGAPGHVRSRLAAESGRERPSLGRSEAPTGCRLLLQHGQGRRAAAILKRTQSEKLKLNEKKLKSNYIFNIFHYISYFKLIISYFKSILHIMRDWRRAPACGPSPDGHLTQRASRDKRSAQRLVHRPGRLAEGFKQNFTKIDQILIKFQFILHEIRTWTRLLHWSKARIPPWSQVS